MTFLHLMQRAIGGRHWIENTMLMCPRSRLNSTTPLRTTKTAEFYDTIKDYKDRIVHSMGLRSDKALTLFNQIVGVKVLNDLDDFIRNNMLEQRDTEEEYNRLNDSFARLIV